MLPNAPAPERSGLTSAPLVGSEEQPTHASPRWMNRGDATRPGARGSPQRRDQMDEQPRAEDEDLPEPLPERLDAMNSKAFAVESPMARRIRERRQREAWVD